MYMASTGSTAPFMVMETDILSRGIPSKRTFMSSTESIGTPILFIRDKEQSGEIDKVISA